MPKIKSKYLIFKTSIIRVNIYLLMNSGKKTELIDKSFVCTNKIPFFKLEKLINFILRNGKVV